MKAYPQDSDGRFMDLRDYFASKAMEGLISSTSALEGEALVARAYFYADLMMKAREVK